MLDGWGWSRYLPLNRVGNDHPIDLQPVKKDEQLRPVCTYCVLSIPFLLRERANGAAMNTVLGRFTNARIKGHHAVTG